MNRQKIIAFGAAMAGLVTSLIPGFAQTTAFRNYRCADGTEFIVGFYPHDSQAYLQIDGGAVVLPRRPSLSGARYSKSGITLKISKAGHTTVKRPKRRQTACELS